MLLCQVFAEEIKVERLVAVMINTESLVSLLEVFDCLSLARFNIRNKHTLLEFFVSCQVLSYSATDLLLPLLVQIAQLEFLKGYAEFAVGI